MRKNKRAALHNLGCKVNAYETEKMQQQLEAAGYEIVPFSEEAEVYVINTCSVTAIADQKSRQMIRRARRKNPSAIVVAAGCYVQQEGLSPEDLGCDLILGNDCKGQLAQRLAEWESSRQEFCADAGAHKEEETAGDENNESVQIFRESNYQTDTNKRTANKSDKGKNAGYVRRVNLNDRGKTYEELYCGTLPERKMTDHRTRAFVKVQDGCNAFCTYCRIPYVRGRERSRDRDSVLEEIRSLVAEGCQEVVLTGIHLSAYRDGENGLIDRGDRLRNRHPPPADRFLGSRTRGRDICPASGSVILRLSPFPPVPAERQ